MEPVTEGPKGSGLVFNIQRFSVHDGPGVRTTVFVKGCPLRCLWCSNPESQSFAPTLIARDVACKACGACVAACPHGAIRIDAEDGRTIDWQRCDQCLRCAAECPYGSLNVCGWYTSVDEVLAEVLRDAAFYRNSGGGITVSGGEPLSHCEFVGDLLRASKRAGLHAVLDTTGHGSRASLEALLPLVDLFLWDVKHLDPDAHRRATGVGNELGLANLRIASKANRIWLRVPLIAGFNDSEEHIREVARLGRRIGAEKISLLPYHEGGKAKSEQVGRANPYLSGAAPDKARIVRLQELIEREGLCASIGS